MNIYSWCAIIIFPLACIIRYEKQRPPGRKKIFDREYYLLLLGVSVFEIIVIVMSNLISARG